MRNPILKQIVLPLLIVVAGFSGIISLSDFTKDKRPPIPDSFADSDLSMNGSRLRGFALGMEGLLADWYWVRSLQYIGDKMVARRDDNREVNLDDLTTLNPRLLLPLLENATDLDPHFVEAYSYGSIVLPAIDEKKAIAFAEKGIGNNPANWRLYQYLGYIYWQLGDFTMAAENYQKGAELPGAAIFMRLMAATMLTDGGSRTTARKVYSQLLAESGDETIRPTAERRLLQLEWLDQRDAINAVLENFKETNGRCSNSFAEIAGALSRVVLPDGGQFRIDAGRRLVDPTDAPYKLDKEKCVVVLDAELTKLPKDK